MFYPKTKNYKLKTYHGFTVVEVIVGMSVFLVAATIIASIFVRAVRTERQANEVMTATSDAGLILERIAREIREGYDFALADSSSSCTPPSIPPSTPLTQGELLCFSRAKAGGDISVGYRFVAADSAVERAEVPGADSAVDPVSYTRLNSDKTSIEHLEFYLVNPPNSSHPRRPWRIAVVLSVKPSDPQNDYAEQLQTTVSARILPEEALLSP